MSSYLRMSDERQEHSIPAQREELLRYAEKHNYRVLREYLDEAISGDDTGRRVGFLRMREDSQQASSPLCSVGIRIVSGGSIPSRAAIGFSLP